MPTATVVLHPSAKLTMREAFALAWNTGRSLKKVGGNWIVGGVTV